MKRKKMILYGFFATLIVVGFLAWKYTSRTAYEAAEYTVVESEGDFEIRDYPELVLATTEMRSRSPEGDGSGDGSFMRLFGYISGENDQQQKVAMTVPCLYGSRRQRGIRSDGIRRPEASRHGQRS